MTAFTKLSYAVPLFATPSVLATVGAAFAAPRTFVATSGVDNATCSLAAPCRTFGAAMTATSVGGEVIVLDSGDYGPVTINKSSSINAPSGLYAGISVAAGFDGITVNAPGATVVLRGLSINGQGGGIGIKVTQASRVRIEGVVVSGMASDGVRQTGDGMELVVIDTVVRDNGGDGISISGASTAQIDRVRLVHNGGNGLAANSNAKVTATNSLSSRNVGTGVLAHAAASTSTYMSVSDTVMSDNTGAGFKSQQTAADASTCVTALVTRSTIVRNASGIALQSPANINTPGHCLAVAVSDANVVSGNTIGFDGGNGFAGFIYTRQNSTLWGNSTDINIPPIMYNIGGQ